MDEPDIAGSAQSLHGLMLQCSVWNTWIPASVTFSNTDQAGSDAGIHDELSLSAHNDNTQDPELENQHEQRSE
jgi:hypothetical protein